MWHKSYVPELEILNVNRPSRVVPELEIMTVIEI